MAFMFLRETIKTMIDARPSCRLVFGNCAIPPWVHEIVFINYHMHYGSIIYPFRRLASHTSRWLPDIEVNPAADWATPCHRPWNGRRDRGNRRDRVTIVSSGHPRRCSFRLVQSTARSLLGRAFDPETMPCDDDCGPGPRATDYTCASSPAGV